METKLYVSNLAQTTTAEDLRMLFSKTGQVVSVEVIRDRGSGKSKGFAFVEMVSQGDAGKAISEYNGYSLDNRQIRVTLAQSRDPQSGRSSRQKKYQYTEYKSYNESIKTDRGSRYHR